VGNVGATYSFKFDLWGGVGPFTWTVDSGALPTGLTLSPATGTLTGKPGIAGTYTFSVRTTDSVLATQAAKPRTFVTRQMKLSVSP
jgi:hypothetical protein